MTIPEPIRVHLPFDEGWLVAWCLRWQVSELAFFGRKVDLVSRRAVEASRNPVRRHHILDSAQVVYAA